MLVLFLNFFFCVLLATVDATGYSVVHWRMETDWGYGESTVIRDGDRFEGSMAGPSDWCRAGYKECCGNRQSPINLNTQHAHCTSVSRKTRMPSNIRMVNYDDVPERIILKNNVDTVKFEIVPKSPDLAPTTSLVDCPYNYVLDNIHFHWGENSSFGSEHTIDGERFPLEVHFVHRDSRYKTADTASLQVNCIVVLCTLFKISAEDNPDLSELVRGLEFVQFAEETYNDIAPFSVSKMLPNSYNDSAYFTYSGSFTTPPCTQGVRWVVFKNPILISEQQAFRDLKASQKKLEWTPNRPLVNNFRPLQPTNDRDVFGMNFI